MYATKFARIATATLLIGVATLPAFAQTAVNVGASATVNKPAPKAAISDVAVACMQAAVEKRDTSITNAFGSYATAMQTALTARKEALKASWALGTKKDRRYANTQVVVNWQASSKAARKSLTTTREAAWKTYATDRKACKGGSEDMSDKGLDGAL